MGHVDDQNAFRILKIHKNLISNRQHAPFCLSLYSHLSPQMSRNFSNDIRLILGTYV